MLKNLVLCAKNKNVLSLYLLCCFLLSTNLFPSLGMDGIHEKTLQNYTLDDLKKMNFSPVLVGLFKSIESMEETSGLGAQNKGIYFLKVTSYNNESLIETIKIESSEIFQKNKIGFNLISSFSDLKNVVILPHHIFHLSDGYVVLIMPKAPGEQIANLFSSCSNNPDILLEAIGTWGNFVGNLSFKGLVNKDLNGGSFMYDFSTKTGFGIDSGEWRSMNENISFNNNYLHNCYSILNLLATSATSKFDQMMEDSSCNYNLTSDLLNKSQIFSWGDVFIRAFLSQLLTNDLRSKILQDLKCYFEKKWNEEKDSKWLPCDFLEKPLNDLLQEVKNSIEIDYKRIMFLRRILYFSFYDFRNEFAS